MGKISIVLQKVSNTGFVLGQWPSVQGQVVPANASLRLFGGAAFERCLSEFQEAATVLELPQGECGLRRGSFC